MKILILSLIMLWSTIATSIADHPYWPVSKKYQLTVNYVDKEMLRSMKSQVMTLTGKVKEQDGKKYYIFKNWTINAKGEKIYPSESLTRINVEGDVFFISPGSKTEILALPAMSKLKVGYTWKVNGGKISSKVIAMDGKLKHAKVVMDNLLVVLQDVGEGIKVKAYFKKNVGAVAASRIDKDGKETLITILDKVSPLSK